MRAYKCDCCGEYTETTGVWDKVSLDASEWKRKPRIATIEITITISCNNRDSDQSYKGLDICNKCLDELLYKAMFKVKEGIK